MDRTAAYEEDDDGSNPGVHTLPAKMQMTHTPGNGYTHPAKMQIKFWLFGPLGLVQGAAYPLRLRLRISAAEIRISAAEILHPKRTLYTLKYFKIL